MQQGRISDDGRQRGNAGVDLRTRVRKLGAKEQARMKKCKVRFSLFSKNKAFQKNYMKVGVKKLLRGCMMPARIWGVHAVVMAPTERLKLRRQKAAAAGKTSTALLSLFMETYGLKVEEELSTLATQYMEPSWQTPATHRRVSVRLASGGPLSRCFLESCTSSRKLLLKLRSKLTGCLNQSAKAPEPL